MWKDFTTLFLNRFLVISIILGILVSTGSSQDYDDKDVQFDPSPPNLLILLADPKNGSTIPLSNEPNTEVVLDGSIEKVHLFCSAYYPIKWVYKGDGFPFMNVDNTRFSEDFYDPTTYAFSALLELEGLKESQTGNYTCQKFDNDTLSSSYHIYIPGDRILLPENNTKIYVDAAVSSVRIPCSVSDPQVNITLLKSFDKGQGHKVWMSISSSFYSYHPKTGFIFKGGSVLTAIGDFICAVGEDDRHRVHLSVVVNNTAAGINTPLTPDCCGKPFLRSLGNERTSCRSFISESCQSPEYLNPTRSPCSDWKIADFLKSPVELCKEEIAPSNSSVAVGYFSTNDQGGPRLYAYCQANPKDYTQGFKMAVEWANGSMVFVEEERLLVPALSDYPSGYEVHAEITDLLNPSAPMDPLILHCYIPLKYSFKWIKILKPVGLQELKLIGETWYNVSTTTEESPTTITTQPPRTRRITTTTASSIKPKEDIIIDEMVENHNSILQMKGERQRARSQGTSVFQSFYMFVPILSILVLL